MLPSDTKLYFLFSITEAMSVNFHRLNWQLIDNYFQKRPTSVIDRNLRANLTFFAKLRDALIARGESSYYDKCMTGEISNSGGNEVENDLVYYFGVLRLRQVLILATKALRSNLRANLKAKRKSPGEISSILQRLSRLKPGWPINFTS